MYNANVIEVLIASPSDVKEERQLVKDILHKWNSLHSSKENIILKSLCWEDDVYSSFECDYPQENINNQILKDADILIGIFGKRIGTPTPKYHSGSIEEIKEHIDSGKPAMLFFSNAENKSNKIDQDQLEKLEEFKKECFQQGIATEYESKDDFFNKFDRQLGLLINDKIIPKIISNQPSISQDIQKTTELSDLAKIILTKMSQDHDGFLMHVKTLDGEYFGACDNNWNFINQPRELAKFESAIEELKNEDLIQYKDTKRQHFKITNNGYKLADTLK
ncbi:MAG: hypothetical protein PHR82_09610 [Endomicrobiaceae bacterium]|nr:hypothetical protein [Endomicrobiaceae bacterium]